MYTYIIKSHGLYKIGKTASIEKRMFTYSLHNPFYEVVGYLNGDVEDYLHDFFREYFISREWYKIPKRYINELIIAANKQNNWFQYSPKTIKQSLHNMLKLK